MMSVLPQRSRIIHTCIASCPAADSDRENGIWVLYGKFAPGTKLPPHFHTGTVHFFTTKGQWNYVEYPNDPQTAGSYLYEPGGSVHTFSVPADAIKRRAVAIALWVTYDTTLRATGTKVSLYHCAMDRWPSCNVE